MLFYSVIATLAILLLDFHFDLILVIPELEMKIRAARNHNQSSALLSQNGTQMELSWDVANREENGK